MVRFTISGGEIVPEIDMQLHNTFFDLKEKIQEELSVEVSRQSLWFNTREVKDHEFIKDYEFGQGAALSLTVRPIPGSPKLHVLVKFAGSSGYIRMRETDNVYSLRRKVEKYWGIPLDLLTIRRLSKEMEDDRPLYAYYINEDTEVELSVHIEPR